MRTLRVVLDDSGGYAFKTADDVLTAEQTVVQYKKEHCATLLEIELNDELKEDSISCYTLAFNMGSTLENRFDIKHTDCKITADSNPDYVADGVIYYQLPDALTAFSSLCVQVEAHTLDENGLLASTLKSTPFVLRFENSVDGVPAEIPGSSNGFIAEFQQALCAMNETVEQADELFEKINTAYKNGELNGEQGEPGANATVNGYNAVEITGGENITVKQDGDKIIIDDEQAHTHSNAATLDRLHCEAVENTLVSSSDADYLTFNGAALRRVLDGAVIKKIEELEKDGKPCIRLYFRQDAFVLHAVPEFIDLLVAGSNEVEIESEDGLTLNGIELEFGSTSESGSSGIPVVTALPDTASEGAIVLYAPEANRFNSTDNGKTIYFNYDWISDYDGSTEYYDALMVEVSTGTADTVLFATNDCINIAVSDGDGALCNMIWNKNADGVFEFSADESCLQNGEEYVTIYEPVESFTLAADFWGEPELYNPGFTCPFTWFYIKPEMYVYRNGKWSNV